MKKLLSLTLALFCFISASPIAQAADKTYDLPELNMTIDAPEGWMVFTKDMDENEPDLEFLGEKKADILANINEESHYLTMIRSDPFTMIRVMMSDSKRPDNYNYNNLTDEAILQKASNMQEFAETDTETDIPDYSVYRHKQTKFAVIDWLYSEDGDTKYAKMYSTVINGQNIYIFLMSYSEISGSLDRVLKETVDSITFTKIAPKPAAPEAAAFELPELNMKIHSPEGWFAFTRDVSSGDPNLKTLGLDSTYLANYYMENNIYLHMESLDVSAEIFVIKADPDAGRDSHDFNKMADDDILLTALSEAQKRGRHTALSDCSIYRHRQTIFAACDFYFNLENDKRTYHGRVYYTVINGQTISIMLVIRGGELYDSVTQTLKSVVDSITLTKVSSKPADDFNFIAVYASLAGAALGAIIGAAILTIRKRRMAG